MKKKWILTAVAASALLLAACGSDGDSGSDTTTTATQETTTTAAPETTTTPGSETTTAGASEGVHTADTDLGTILVNGDGFAMYFFTPDTDGESTCYDACATAWPPVPADEALGSELDSSLFGSTTRTTGMEQLTVNGKPVYLFAADSNPGDTNGQGVNDVWFVIDADGNMVGG